MSQKIINRVIKSIKFYLSNGKTQEAIETLKKEIAPISNDLETSIIMQAGNYSNLKQQNLMGIISDQKYNMGMNKLNFSILSLLGTIETEIKVKEMMGEYKSIYTTTSEDKLQKIQGTTNNLVPMSWIHKCIEASKSVFQVIRNDGNKGTGWMLEGGWMMTNAHVIPNKEYVTKCKIVFNFEEDIRGSNAKTSIYTLNPEGALFSSLLNLDYAYIKVNNDGDLPLSNWGHLDVDTFSVPQKDQGVTIIQHPKGEKKQIALTENKIVNVDGKKVFYMTDTEKGSSGAPVLNKEWNVVALHHAGKTEEEGGLVIDHITGEKQGANEGILISKIMEDIKSKQSV